jgi:hypothetical protein
MNVVEMQDGKTNRRKKKDIEVIDDDDADNDEKMRVLGDM